MNRVKEKEMIVQHFPTCNSKRIPDRDQPRLSPLCRVKLKFRSVPVIKNTAADIGMGRFSPLSANLVTEVKDF